MAYNPYFPATYPQNYYGPNPYFQQMQNQSQMFQQQQAQQQTQQPQIQQSGFVLVQSEQEARAYPVAPGNSITFKDERLPYCYVKTMGFNQLDQPTFERYRLVKEETVPQAAQTPTAATDASEGKHTEYATKADIREIWGELEALKAQGEKKTAKARKTETEVTADE